MNKNLKLLIISIIAIILALFFTLNNKNESIFNNKIYDEKNNQSTNVVLQDGQCLGSQVKNDFVSNEENIVANESELNKDKNKICFRIYHIEDKEDEEEIPSIEFSLLDNIDEIFNIGNLVFDGVSENMNSIDYLNNIINDNDIYQVYYDYYDTGEVCYMIYVKVEK